MLKSTNISYYGYTGSSPFRACPDFSSGRSGDEVVEGNVITVFSDRKIAQDIDADGVIDSYKGVLLASNDYTPFGMQMANRGLNASIGLYRFGFNGHEKDDEVKGSGNHLSFGDYGYDARLGRRWNIEPKIGKYPSFSSYLVFGNNPIINMDPDGEDKVYFNADGTEAYREKNNKEFKTYIKANKNAGNPQVSVANWKEVAMPKIINERPTNIKGKEIVEATTGIDYQKNDYLIAARVGYFNQAKNSGQLNLYTEGGNAIPQDAVKAIPDLDPTLIKAVAMQESHLGVLGDNDIMTANNKGDWPDGEKMKPALGLNKGDKLSTTNSLYYGIRIMAGKGFKGGVDGKGGYTFQGWDKAVGNYNGNGTEGYSGYVNSMFNNSTTPNTDNYVKPTSYPVDKTCKNQY